MLFFLSVQPIKPASSGLAAFSGSWVLSLLDSQGLPLPCAMEGKPGTGRVLPRLLLFWDSQAGRLSQLRCVPPHPWLNCLFRCAVLNLSFLPREALWGKMRSESSQTAHTPCKMLSDRRKQPDRTSLPQVGGQSQPACLSVLVYSISVCSCLMCLSARSRKRVFDPLELEQQAFVAHLACFVGARTSAEQQAPSVSPAQTLLHVVSRSHASPTVVHVSPCLSWSGSVSALFTEGEPGAAGTVTPTLSFQQKAEVDRGLPLP